MTENYNYLIEGAVQEDLKTALKRNPISFQKENIV